MRAYCDGDPAAFKRIYDRYAPRLWASIKRDVRSVEDVHEIVQQTFLQLHRARFDFRQGAALRPWIYTIAFNLRREYFRKRYRRPEAPLELDGRQDPSVDADDRTRDEQAVLVRRAIARLPENQRQVIELHWLEELPFPEVATIAGASVSAVKVRAHRGYLRLRELLADSAPIPTTERNQNPTGAVPLGRPANEPS